MSSSKRAVYGEDFRWAARYFVDWGCWMVGFEVVQFERLGKFRLVNFVLEPLGVMFTWRLA